MSAGLPPRGTDAGHSGGTYHFRLFVAGESPRSSRAINNLRLLCERALPDAHKIEVIDVLERPDLAEAASVLATPMVMRMQPLPQRRAVGDFNDLARLAAAIDLHTPDSRDETAS